MNIPHRLFNNIQAILNSNKGKLKEIQDDDKRVLCFIALLEKEYPNTSINSIPVAAFSIKDTVEFPDRWFVGNTILPQLKRMLETRDLSGDASVAALYNQVHNQI